MNQVIYHNFTQLLSSCLLASYNDNLALVILLTSYLLNSNLVMFLCNILRLFGYINKQAVVNE